MNNIRFTVKLVRPVIKYIYFTVSTTDESFMDYFDTLYSVQRFVAEHFPDADYISAKRIHSSSSLIGDFLCTEIVFHKQSKCDFHVDSTEGELIKAAENLNTLPKPKSKSNRSLKC